MPDPALLAEYHLVLAGDGSPNVVAAGHSHRMALVTAAQGTLGDWGMRAAVLGSDHGYYQPPDANYWNVLDHVAREAAVVLVWGGNEHNTYFLFEPEEPFTVIGESTPQTGDAVRVIPREMVRALWQSIYDDLQVIVERLTPVTRVVVLGTPPPKPWQFVRKAVVDEVDLVQEARKRGLDPAAAPVTSDSLRVALWGIVQEALEETAGKSGALFVPVSPDLMDEQGTLPLEYCALDDATHANARYGKRMWEAIGSALGSTQIAHV